MPMNKLKTKFSNTIEALKAELYVTLAKICTGDATAFSKSDRAVGKAAVISSAVAYSAVGAFAEADIIQKASSMLSEYYLKISGMATLIAAFCIIIALIWALISPSPGASQTPIGWIKKILICWFLILAFGGVVSIMNNITEGLGWDTKN